MMEESIPAVPPALIHGRLLLSFRVSHLLQIFVDNVIKFSLKQKSREIV